MKIELLEIAKLELDDATEYYESVQDGLGKRFKQEVKRCLKMIGRFPNIGYMEEKDTRRVLVDVFPYKLFYTTDEDKIIVLAIAHQHRKPYHYIERLQEEQK